jgi:glycine dehydrogenase subunit 1
LGVPGVSLLHPDAPFFKEFALRVPGDAQRVVEGLVEHGYLGGVAFPRAGEDVLLVAVTERRTREQIDGFVAAMEAVVA